jgi:hypothetical protein
VQSSLTLWILIVFDEGTAKNANKSSAYRFNGIMVGGLPFGGCCGTIRPLTGRCWDIEMSPADRSDITPGPFAVKQTRPPCEAEKNRWRLRKVGKERNHFAIQQVRSTPFSSALPVFLLPLPSQPLRNHLGRFRMEAHRTNAGEHYCNYCFRWSRRTCSRHLNVWKNTAIKIKVGIMTHLLHTCSMLLH